MRNVTENEAREQLPHLIEDAAGSHEPIHIRGKSAAAVLVSEEDWRAVQETLYLLNIPGMRESIVEGLRTPPGECVDRLDW